MAAPMHEWGMLVAAIFFCLLGNGFFSGSEIALLSAKRGQVYVHVQRAPKGQMRWYAHVARLLAVSHAVADQIVAEAPQLRAKVRVIPNALPFRMDATLRKLREQKHMVKPPAGKTQKTPRQKFDTWAKWGDKKTKTTADDSEGHPQGKEDENEEEDDGAAQQATSLPDDGGSSSC